ncbi:hypothetical protein QJS10_CPA02g00712 [Acorus calamus]|uniref:Uncharacterized protein n=1 Tax=Acorus calamus TaxID=4465 RepID=A0AAV9FCP6_ACOCL|nr:hypothetical protein QJS10_CPA02g00712 [Acorus calamus]
MASFEEEERLVQMVHDFIEPSSPPPPTTTTSSSSSPHPSLHQLEAIIGSSTDGEMEVLQRVVKHLSEMGSEKTRSSNCVKKKRLMMKLRTNGYDASLCRSSWVSTLDCPSGDYEYIDIVMVGGSTSTRLIVDIDFKSQFELVRPTRAYTELSNTLPDIFVGNEEKLNRVISLLCSAAQQSLKERGLHVPPWRKATYMKSKWLSCCQKSLLLSGFQVKGMVKMPNRGLGGGGGGGGAYFSALSRQFSELCVNCC